MAPSDAIKQILPAFEQYYTVKKENITPPFCAEAERAAASIRNIIITLFIYVISF